ncbi:hypothetical protein A4X03_0g2135 [Tilletia caries]|uniref:tRNA-splicing endonuclease subunit Sen54 N-terminal domain-containing protein n=1 Tax=Tilletia caries TaxID=13290 RepID=A0A8T8TNI8_9BASI|nr:hypothetical protein A4X03_0g2135 [Tilletia caries]
MTTIPYDLDLDLDLRSLSQQDPDAPTASGSAEAGPSSTAKRSAAVATGTSASAGSGAAAGAGGAGSDSEDDDAAPDYRLLGKLLPKTHHHAAAAASEDAPSPSDSLSQARGTPEGKKASNALPKRGEKDFEPTGFRATWDPILQRAILHSSKGILLQAMGLTNRLPQHDDPPAKIDANGTRWPRIVSRIELSPEETLFLLERGVLDCRLRLPLHGDDEGAEDQRRQRAGQYRLDEGNDELLDVKRAFGLILGADGCSKEVYGVYSYLRRLGYIVHRATDVDLVRSRAAEKSKADREHAAGPDDEDGDEGERVKAEGIVADRDRPLRLVTLWDIMLYLPRRLLQLGGDAIRWIGGWAHAAAAWLAGVVRRVVSRVGSTAIFRRSTRVGSARSGGRGPGLLGIGGRTFSDFDSVFSELQIVPTGHDLPFPSSTQDQPNQKPTTTPSSSSRQPTPPPFKPFFYAWRPAGHFRKSYPPPPEFRIAICNARLQQHIPSLSQFVRMFEEVPMPGMEALDKGDAERAREMVRVNNASYGRAQSTKVRAPRKARMGGEEVGVGVSKWAEMEGAGGVVGSLLRALRMMQYLLELVGSRLFSHCVPGAGRFGTRRAQSSRVRGPGGAGGAGRGMNPFFALKSGRRNVIVAVVDQGTTSLIRFGEAEFARWRMAGADR